MKIKPQLWISEKYLTLLWCDKNCLHIYSEIGFIVLLTVFSSSCFLYKYVMYVVEEYRISLFLRFPLDILLGITFIQQKWHYTFMTHLLCMFFLLLFLCWVYGTFFLTDITSSHCPHIHIYNSIVSIVL